MWTELGNQVSRIYCGTESVSNRHRAKKEKENNGFWSSLYSGIKSINRNYQASINDGVKQECLDYFLGRKE
jgi:hypothetical protein